MRNPLEYFKKEIEQADHLLNHTTTEATEESSADLSEEDIIKRNEFIMDFIVKQ